MTLFTLLAACNTSNPVEGIWVFTASPDGIQSKSDSSCDENYHDGHCPAAEELVDEAIKVAGEIAAMSAPSVIMAKESVNRAFETTLSEGLRFERRAFNAVFGTEDKKEGMAAFLEKRKPIFENR